MEAPPREKRARAAFFREKDAQRAAKQQRKKAKLMEKIAGGGAKEKDGATTFASAAVVEAGVVERVETFAHGRAQSAHDLRPLRTRPLLHGTPARDPMVGLSTTAGRVTMWQGQQSWHTAFEGMARLSPTPGVALGLIGEGTNGLGSSSSSPWKGVCVHCDLEAPTQTMLSISATRVCRFPALLSR